MFFFLIIICFPGCQTKDPTKNSSEFDLDLFQKKFIETSEKDSIREVIKKIPGDQFKNDLLFSLSYHYYKENDSTEFLYWNNETFNLSRKLKDTLKIAEAHWDRASFHNQAERIDSAFYHYRKAAALYNLKKDKFHFARMLLNIAILQKNIRDYTGSEANTTEALKIIIPLQENRQIYIGYNNLGILFNQLSEYNEALHYHKKALHTANDMSDGYLKASSLNNIGVVYENKKDYKKAKSFYIQALQIDSLRTKDIRLFAMLKDNLAYAELMSGSEEVLPKLLEALKLREEADHAAGIVINKLHLSEYYLLTGDTITAEKEALEAKNIAEKVHLHRDILQSLLVLSKVDQKKSQDYLNSYIHLQDSLEKKERSARSKFARIELQTDEFIAQNEELTEQRTWIIGGSLSTISMILLMVVIWRQKNKNKKLQLEREQQQANEHIYNLLLEHENKIEEGRKSEKERISKELHDGVLGTMYGVRFNLINLNSKSDTGSLENREKLLDRLQTVEEEIRTISRDLQKESVFGKIGFISILQHLAKEKKKQLGFLPTIHYEKDIEWLKVSNQSKMNLYRIIQEALHNTLKYAEASAASISFTVSNNKLFLLIKDNGKGFDSDKNVSGIGIKNMKSRVSHLGGNMSIISNNLGTRLHIAIPLEHDEEVKDIDGR